MNRKLFSYFVLTAFTTFQLGSCKRKDTAPIDNVYRFSETMTVDGRVRTYTLNLPPTYYTGVNFSLVIALHGGGGDALQFESTSRLTAKANEGGFVVVYPEGVKSTGVLGARSWNAGQCCDYARNTNVDDVNFIRQLIAKLSASYKINPRKIYATGHSNGGMLAYRLACELSDKIAAIAPNSATMALTKPGSSGSGLTHALRAGYQSVLPGWGRVGHWHGWRLFSSHRLRSDSLVGERCLRHTGSGTGKQQQLQIHEVVGLQ